MTSSVPNGTAFEYVADGVTKAFSFPLRFLEAADLRVRFQWPTLDIEEKVLGTHYTVSGAGNLLGGTVTFSVAPASGITVSIARFTVAKQTLDFEDNNRVPGNSLEQQLDRITMALQDMQQRFAEVETTPGPPGMGAWLFGDGAPGSGLGADSDLYNDRLTGDLYQKVAGAWVFQINIKGPEGQKGDKGDEGDIEGYDIAALIARVDALEDEGFQPGDLVISTRRLTTDPTGWLLLRTNRTIGSASSGADVGSADCEALFLRLWADYTNGELQIRDSTGAFATRGASAAADWAANKRLPLPDPKDRFPRFGSLTRSAGLTEANQNKQHLHPAVFAGAPLDPHQHGVTRPRRYGANDNSSGNSDPGWDAGDQRPASSDTRQTAAVSAGTPAGTVTLTAEGGTEARPDSFVVTAMIKL